MTAPRWPIGLVVTVFLAAIAGVFIGRTLLPDRHHQGSELHALIHHDLKLDRGQQQQLDLLEQAFAARSHVIELQLSAANAGLAEAIEAEHGNGPRVEAAVDASHLAMGELQKATLAHVFAMRQILKPDQAAMFDKAVVKALTSDAK